MAEHCFEECIYVESQKQVRMLSVIVLKTLVPWDQFCTGPTLLIISYN
jgi:hypothetical protein